MQGPYDYAIVLSLKINTHRVKMALVDTGSSADILYLDAFEKMEYSICNLKKVQTSLVVFTGDTLYSEGVIEIQVESGGYYPFCI
jgi:choline kinase